MNLWVIFTSKLSWVASHAEQETDIELHTVLACYRRQRLKNHKLQRLLDDHARFRGYVGSRTANVGLVHGEKLVAKGAV